MRHASLVRRPAVFITLLALVAAACAPAASPSPTAAPAKPAATTAPAKPTEAPAAKTAEKPAANATEKPAAAPAQKSGDTQAAKPASKPEDIQVPKPSGNLSFKMGHSSEKQFPYITQLITTQRLNSQGWNIEDVYFAQSELNTEAVAKGDVGLTLGASNTLLLATQKGIKTPLLAEWTRNDWVVVSRNDLKSCADLNGKQVAYHSEGAVSTAMLKQWVNEECGGSPNYLVISGSTNRANALINNQIDATPLFLIDWIKVDMQAPGRFHILRTFADGLPNLTSNTYAANADWLAQNRPVAVAYFAELLKTNRMGLANPSLLVEAARKEFPELDPALLEKSVTLYNEINAFPPNGGVTAQMVEGTIKFFTEAGQIEPGLTVQEAADLSVLEDALDIVGRVPGKP